MDEAPPEAAVAWLPRSRETGGESMCVYGVGEEQTLKVLPGAADTLYVFKKRVYFREKEIKCGLLE